MFSLYANFFFMCLAMYSLYLSAFQFHCDGFQVLTTCPDFQCNIHWDMVRGVGNGIIFNS